MVNDPFKFWFKPLPSGWGFLFSLSFSQKIQIDVFICMGATFEYDLSKSQEKEKQFELKLSQQGWTTTSTSDKGCFSGYDIQATKNTTTSTYEVKFDQMESLTGNVAVEVCKEINGKRMPSGMTSTTATHQVYCFEGDNNFYIIESVTLADLIKGKKYKRVVKGGDNYSSLLCLFDSAEFKQMCSIF